jgi:ABC-type Na+ efflux pump permease subunit
VPVTAHLSTHPATTSAQALVDTGVGSLSGWVAALLVVVALGLIAWWATRPARRRKR